MKIINTKNYNEMSKKAAEIIIEEISKKPNLVLGLATGFTSLRLYQELVKVYEKRKINFSKIRSFNLDEYYPIKKKDKNSFYYFMHKNLFSKINIKKENVNILDGEAKNPENECENYENKIRKNKIDIQILGVGVNGHIGFNEPGSGINSRTRLVKLASQTLKDNSRFFRGRKIPRYALSMGISSIMVAKRIILLASGKNKARAMNQLIERKVSKKWPVSFLRKHKNLVIVLDKDAASLLED